jgi:hypothetical protein
VFYGADYISVTVASPEWCASKRASEESVLAGSASYSACASHVAFSCVASPVDSRLFSNFCRARLAKAMGGPEA